VVLVGWAEHLEGVAIRQLEDGEVGHLQACGQPEHPSQEPHHGGVLAGSRSRPPDPRDPHRGTFTISQPRDRLRLG
jgi:hypothetical protein